MSSQDPGPVPGTGRLTLVYAAWCPHCEPLSRERAPHVAARLGAELRILDIDHPEEEAIADRLVRQYGDDGPDYLIPQLFYEAPDGSVRHLLTGVPGSLAATAAEWERLLHDPALSTAPARRAR